jgi:hypothetical protein
MPLRLNRLVAFIFVFIGICFRYYRRPMSKLKFPFPFGDQILTDATPQKYKASEIDPDEIERIEACTSSHVDEMEAKYGEKKPRLLSMSFNKKPPGL